MPSPRTADKGPEAPVNPSSDQQTSLSPEPGQQPPHWGRSEREICRVHLSTPSFRQPLPRALKPLGTEQAAPVRLKALARAGTKQRRRQSVRGQGFREAEASAQLKPQARSPSPYLNLAWSSWYTVFTIGCLGRGNPGNDTACF